MFSWSQWQKEQKAIQDAYWKEREWWEQKRASEQRQREEVLRQREIARQRARELEEAAARYQARINAR